MRVLCQRVERPELFTFVAEPQASADNNAAEQPASAGGKPEDQRGHPFGQSETKSILASLFGTWRLQERNPYHALRSLLSQPHLAPL